MSEERIEEKEQHRPLLLMLYASILCMIFVLFSICLHYGWATLREDSPLTVDDYTYMSMLFCGIFSAVNISGSLYRYSNIHPAFLNGVRIFNIIVMIICVIGILDVGSDGGPDWVAGGIYLLVMCVIMGAYIYWLKRKGPDGKTNEERLVEKSKAKGKAHRIKRFTEHEVMESRTDIGLENYGWMTMEWDGRRSYYHIRKTVLSFCIILGLTSLFMVVGKHIEDVEIQAALYFLCYLMGCIILRGFIFQYLDYGVLHNAIPYREGARYKLLLIAAYTLVCLTIYNIVFEECDCYWNVWVYVSTVAVYFILFVVTFMISTIINKHDGHDFAFFDTDGYEKRKRDPREESEEEKKE